jgi:predicted Zn-dependent protease
MIKVTPVQTLLIVSMLPLLNACTVTLPNAGERRTPVERPSRTVIKPAIKPRPDLRRNSPAITQPYRPARSQPQPRSRPTGMVRPADQAESGRNPYDNVPQSGREVSARNSPIRSSTGTSSAVKALLLRAKVDIVAARYEDGASRLERAIRIEPRNAEVWHQLARINYKQGKHASSITMAQKSNRYTASDSPLEKANWSLIKQASKAAGDIKTLKKAIQYERSHP